MHGIEHFLANTKKKHYAANCNTRFNLFFFCVAASILAIESKLTQIVSALPLN